MLNSQSSRAQDDEVLMGRVELALAQPPESRDTYIESACGGDSELIAKVRNYVHWEETMDRFLLDPLYSRTVAEHRFENGERLAGRFRIVRLVAEGGMGVVYEAWDEKLEQRVAVKCAKEGFDKRLLPEVRHASEISHKNVCRIHDIQTHGEIDFFTMEFLEGETLADRLRRGPLPASEARSFARQICAGLAEAHRHGVIHGDLKSNNVILTSDSRPGRGRDESVRAVITDFGLARGPAASTPGGGLQSAEAGGAPDYMAPELWAGKKASTASDVYALGVILYELASGRRPFALDEGPFDRRLDQRPRRNPPPLHAKWHNIKLDPVLARCLDPDPARRFRDAGEVAKALEPSRPLPWWLMAAAVLLAIGVGVATYQSAAAPKEIWRLAMVQVRPSSPEIASGAEALSRDAAVQLRRLKGGNVARFTFVPPGKVDAAAGATHILQVTLSKQDSKTILHAALTDAKSKVNIKDWTVEYASEEMLRYAPMALAGMVTEALNLPPLPVRSVNSAAAKDFWDGVWDTRQRSSLDVALGLLKEAAGEDPDSPLTHAALAEAQWFEYCLTNEEAWLERARKSVQQAEARNPDVAAAHRVEGYLDYKRGSYSQAVSEFERAIQLQPGNATAHVWLGKAYEDDNRLEEARIEFVSATVTEPKYFNTWQNLGAYYQNRSDFNKAAEYYEKAVDLAPEDAILHSNLGGARMSLGDYPRAEAELLESLRLKETAAAYYNLGQVQMYGREEAKAIESFKNALNAKALLTGAPEYLILMYLGIADRRLNHTSEAHSYYQRGLDKAEEEMRRNPHNGRIKAFLGYFNAALGYSRNAKNYIVEALDDSDDLTTAWTAVATYEELHRQSAEQAYRRETLTILRKCTRVEMDDFSRWPDFDSLQKDPEFEALLASK